MIESINSAVTEVQDELAKRFARAEPFPHIAIDDFLVPDLCEQLARTFPSFENGQSFDDENLERAGKAQCEDIRALGPGYRAADDLVRSSAFLDLIGTITGIPDLLYDPDYVGAGTHCNRNGKELNPHIDFNYHPVRGWHRRLNLLLYLNERWDKAWGGCFEVHSDPRSRETDRSTTILPLMNRMVIIETSEHSWHGFKKIALPEGTGVDARKALVFYLYTLERPPERTAPPHSTVYIERLLGERVVPGQPLHANARELIAAELTMRADYAKMLSERDSGLFQQLVARAREALERADGEPLSPALFDLLDIAIKRQDTVLDLFYSRETELAADIARLQEDFAPAPAAEPSALNESDTPCPPIVGNASAVGPTSGIYSDGWVGPAGEFGVRCHGSTRELRFRGKLPPGHRDAELSIEITSPGDTTATGCEIHRFRVCEEEIDLRVPVAWSASAEFRIRFGSTRIHNPAALSQKGDDRDLILLLLAVEVCA